MTEVEVHTEPNGFTLFCDDIRDEVSGKVTYVGCYENQMFVHGTFPLLLPKLGVAVFYREPASLPRVPLTIRIFLPGDSEDAPSIESAMPPEGMPAIENLGGAPIMKATFRALFSPLAIQAPGDIKVRMRRGDQTIKLGRLSILSASETVGSQASSK